MGKPTKNKVWCPDIGRSKMLFETESAAKNFIKFNGDEIIDDVSKLRVYWCPACCGYHISSHQKKETDDGRRTQNLIERYEKVNQSKFTLRLKAKELVTEMPKDKIDTYKALREWISKNAKGDNILKSMLYEEIYKLYPDFKKINKKI